MKRTLKHEQRYMPGPGADEVESPSVWKKVLPAASWLMALAALAAAFVGSGLGQASAAGVGSGTNEQSEAAVAAAHHQQRTSGCTLIVPANPLTAQGLATPYQLSGTGCDESVAADAAFVQAAALDPATGAVAVYNPLVINQGTQPAVNPVVPTLPANAVVGIWFGANTSSLHLQGATGSTLASAQCVNGLGASIFGQMAYCNAPTFFSEANQLIQAGKLVPPALGTGADQQACLTVRDFAVVDQDQSDNVTTTYRVTSNGKLAQNTAANASALAGSTAFGNGSDNRLVAIALDKALGCTPWMAPDLADSGKLAPALPLNELQAAMYQTQPVALVPSGDPMTLVNGKVNLAKQNLYRAGVDQPQVSGTAQATADETAYCQNLLTVAPARLALDSAWTSKAATLDPTVGTNLYTFLAARYAFTIGSSGLNCTGLLHQGSPVQLTQNSAGVVVAATFTPTHA
jgi:hypothetical protein